jgi:hypothetical protein
VPLGREQREKNREEGRMEEREKSRDETRLLPS